MAKLSGTFLIKIALKFSLKLYKKKDLRIFFNLKFKFKIRFLLFCVNQITNVSKKSNLDGYKNISEFRNAKFVKIH